MNTERDYKSEELNESELDNVAGGASDDGRISPEEEQEQMDRRRDEEERARHEGADGSDFNEGETF